ncbi:MAG: 1-deoxy-D-xylulose-5-phosphate synthase [Candidatus Omnitrophica bacterium]|nr:1-deoxy-D-xylulose-5-phosphate synthase [Candidatus Omnitrophota bacterium]
MEYKFLQNIESPEDIRKLSVEDLSQLAAEVRDLIVETVADKGGHLGAGLGVTDLTIVLHYILNTPKDFLVWDVGHQVQAHKILTGRRDAFRKSFRQYKGISGLVNSSESEYDPFTTGHAGPSISQALGIAKARRLQGNTDKVVAVIGDTSIANGMAFEALNHAGHIKENLVVILNDNEMSISPSVGAMTKYFNRIIVDKRYNHLRDEVEGLIKRIPKLGTRMFSKVKHIEEGLKHLLVPGQLFENLNFRYFGPLDGHNIPELVKVLPQIMKLDGPSLVHVITQKGKGLAMAEKDPVRWHASTPFHIETGELKKKSSSVAYTKVFGNKLCELARKNPKITALTAGMPEGTGLIKFSEEFPDRFEDVGISEEHGVTFCAGMAYQGMRPVAAIYSTFLQRAFDQMMHDVCLQNLPVMFCLDRAGLVGEDGPTHHGVLDISYLRKLPNMQVLAPRDGKELESMLEYMADCTEAPTAVRYPRGGVTEEQYPELSELPRQEVRAGKGELLKSGADVLLIAVGSMVGPGLAAAALLEKEGLSTAVINARFVKPLDEELIHTWSSKTRAILTIEEGCLPGGFGSAVIESLVGTDISLERVKCLGLPDRFIEGGNRELLLDLLGLSPEKIAETAKEVLKKSSHSQSASI